ncbi:S9 family peptidase [Gluconobacter wancherniae]|uniref:Peptidase S9 prolyl oligopeptidase catalytic domain-containing protein n=1 Tax=Gluconobacter wancherniae NBRC 103581 TaxID=656744 RepID=A0A511B4E1_9PROT|nr:S9 family peptidase [Gluconobacter wancherniae]MBF0854693.1 S9 family peptidase [Gluconobacter wancherniae]GBD57577.1 acylaminoacyl-peptidase [Gluconobacter wancherniae NBRC 103581]GBR62113.1 putative peptidase [Gluconobacter wancherniae NBRC 103581]GEK94563.1 hypothetical protein GWA01_23330 [Gluconobacter wancherniae NBRC 103581]
MKRSFRLALLAGLLPFAAHAAPLQLRSNLLISPDGSRLFSLDHAEGAPGQTVIPTPTIRKLPSGAVTAITLCNGCSATSFAWSRDGQKLAYVLKNPSEKTRSIWTVDADGHNPVHLLSFDGTLQSLAWGPENRLAVLATAGAHKEPGALQAGAAPSGEIGTNEDEQRIATIENGSVKWQSPADLYVYEYDWRPDGSGFVGTAAPGNGDDHWWIARLYSFADGKSSLLYTPPQEQQLGLPHVSPDGKTVAFIGGLMSDFSFFGGDAYAIDLTKQGAHAINLTPGLHATVTDISWDCAKGLTAAGLQGAQSIVWSLKSGVKEIWRGDDLISNGRGEPSLACAAGKSAILRQTFTQAPEIWAGEIGKWSQITHDNTAQPARAKARSVTWKSDGYSVQGWLLEPLSRKAGVERNGHVPMVVNIHGGPSSAVVARYLSGNSHNMALLDAGYDIFLPNPRGSYGQGEAFTSANRRDFGHGDLRDVQRGIDAVEKIAPVDDARLGLTGYSYGGYMTMWTVTQTNRFHAAVAGGGISDWLSYYGENGIDTWLLPFFGHSVYDDPEIYARSSPMTYIKQVHTPTFIYVGSADEECPMPQSQEFFHALRTFNVPSSLVIYPGQGHALHDPAADADSNQRTVAWFDRYLNP